MTTQLCVEIVLCSSRVNIDCGGSLAVDSQHSQSSTDLTGQ